jgi:PAS domain-containing protein
MPKLIIESRKQHELRVDAEHRLKQGTAPAARASSIGPEALLLLYRLASNPDSASDALQLLHELQVHQVELDLQHGQIEANGHEVAHALGRYKGFYDAAPIGYFIVGFDGKVIECNRAGVRLLQVEGEEVGGRPLAGFLTQQSRPALKGLLQTLRDGGAEAGCEVHSSASGSALRITAAPAPDGATVLMMICESEGSQAA